MNKKTTGISWQVMVAGIAGITLIEMVALSKGIDGKLLITVIGILALAIGVAIPNPIKR